MSKGSQRRPEAIPGLYSAGWEKAFQDCSDDSKHKVYLFTTGSGDDGDEWNVHSIHSTLAGAEKARAEYKWSSNEIEEWEVTK